MHFDFAIKYEEFPIITKKSGFENQRRYFKLKIKCINIFFKYYHHLKYARNTDINIIQQIASIKLEQNDKKNFSPLSELHKIIDQM